MKIFPEAPGAKKGPTFIFQYWYPNSLSAFTLLI